MNTVQRIAKNTGVLLFARIESIGVDTGTAGESLSGVDFL